MLQNVAKDPRHSRPNSEPSSISGATALSELPTDLQTSEKFVLSLLNRRAGIEVLNHLVAIDPADLNRTGRVDYLSALEKQSAWLNELLQRAIVAVAGDEPTKAENLWTGVDEAEREEVAAALRLSGNTAQSRIDVARILVNNLPNTCSALASGEISSAHATVIARESAAAIDKGINPILIEQIELEALAHSEFHTPAQVANKVRTLLAQVAPAAFEEAVEYARDCRRVNLYPEADGMATLVALLPAPDAQTIMLAIDKLARRFQEADRSTIGRFENGSHSSRGATAAQSVEVPSVSGADAGAGAEPEIDHPAAMKTIDAYRADALTLFATNYLATSEDDSLNHRRPVTLNLTMDLPTALGLAENPGQLAGFGPIPASVARELAADAKWRRFITEPVTGALLDYGRLIYEPPQPLVDFLLARDRTCRFPGCRQPGRLADIDHADPWEAGGSTNLENLGLLCRRHHRLKTHGGWKLESFADGSCEWLSPVGKKYQVPARPISETV